MCTTSLFKHSSKYLCAVLLHINYSKFSLFMFLFIGFSRIISFDNVAGIVDLHHDEVDPALLNLGLLLLPLEDVVCRPLAELQQPPADGAGGGAVRLSRRISSMIVCSAA